MSWAYSSPAYTDQIEALVESDTLYLSSTRALGGSSITIPDSVASYLTGSTLSLGEAPVGSFLSSSTFGFTPNTNAATANGLPDEEATALGNMAQNQGPPDGVSRDAPPSPSATLIALAAAGRNPTDLTLPTVGSEAGGSDDDEDDVSSDGTSAAPSSGGVTADGEGEGGGGGSAPGSHLTPEQARAAEFAVMMPGDPTPADYEGYGPGVAKTAKGYYINGPVNMVAGTASALYNHQQTAAAIGNALRHPINTAAAVKEAVVAKFESGAEGQGEVLFNAAVIAFGPKVSGKMTVPTATAGRVGVLAQTTGGVVALQRTVIVVGSKTFIVPAGAVATGAVGGINLAMMAAGDPGGEGGDAPKGIGPDDAVPEGFSFDVDNPVYRQLKDGDQVLQYSLKGEELAVDWVDGGGAASMLKRILAAEGSGVRRISGYATDKLASLSDNALLRYGNQVASSLGEGWKASIEFVANKRYLVFTR